MWIIDKFRKEKHTDNAPDDIGQVESVASPTESEAVHQVIESYDNVDSIIKDGYDILNGSIPPSFDWKDITVLFEPNSELYSHSNLSIEIPKETSAVDRISIMITATAKVVIDTIGNGYGIQNKDNAIDNLALIIATTIGQTLGQTVKENEYE